MAYLVLNDLIEQVPLYCHMFLALRFVTHPSSTQPTNTRTGATSCGRGASRSRPPNGGRAPSAPLSSASPTLSCWPKSTRRGRYVIAPSIAAIVVNSPLCGCYVQPRLQELGFDYTYDKQLYDRLTWGHLDHTKDWFIHNSPSFTKRSAHCTRSSSHRVAGHTSFSTSRARGSSVVSNHDEPREAIHFGSWWRAAAAALLSFTLPVCVPLFPFPLPRARAASSHGGGGAFQGVRFFWHGQWEGHQNKLAVHLRRARDEAPHAEVVAFYDKLLPIVTAEVFKKGEWVYLDVTNSDQSWRLMAWRWSFGKERRLCVINFRCARRRRPPHVVMRA